MVLGLYRVPAYSRFVVYIGFWLVQGYLEQARTLSKPQAGTLYEP
jgi:hypothetical protein